MKNNIIELNNNVIYVKGALNAALYDFCSEKVYSVNEYAVKIIDKFVANQKISDKTECEYLEELKKLNLLAPAFLPRIAHFEPPIDKINFAWLELTESCNLKCLHCYEGNNHKKQNNELSLSEWKKVLDQLKELGCKSTQFIGGEPCLFNQLEALILYAKSLDFDNLTVFSNATMLNDSLIELFSANNINVRFSLYGHNGLVHDSITGIKGSFDKTIKNVNKLIANNIKVIPAVVIMRENQTYVKEIFNFIISLGLKPAGYDVIRNVFGGTQSNHTPDNVEVIQHSLLTKPSFTITKEKFINAMYANTCWYGKCAITPTGNIIPCEFERSIVYGNVRQQSISQILNGDKLKEFWHLDFSKIQICKDCEYRFSCKDCRPLGFSLCGNITQKNPRCLYNPYTGKWQ